MIYKDEADTQLGGVGSDTHATERRLTGKFQSMMMPWECAGNLDQLTDVQCTELHEVHVPEFTDAQSSELHEVYVPEFTDVQCSELHEVRIPE